MSKPIKFQYIAQLKNCQKLDFEGYPITNLKYPNNKNLFSRFQNQVNLYIAQLKYCQNWILKDTLFIT